MTKKQDFSFGGNKISRGIEQLAGLPGVPLATPYCKMCGRPLNPADPAELNCGMHISESEFQKPCYAIYMSKAEKEEERKWNDDEDFSKPPVQPKKGI